MHMEWKQDGQERPIAGDASTYGVEAVFFHVPDEQEHPIAGDTMHMEWKQAEDSAGDSAYGVVVEISHVADGQEHPIAGDTMHMEWKQCSPMWQMDRSVL